MKYRVHITGAELRVIDMVANRALVFFPDRDPRDIKMDVLAAHLHIPLDLNRLIDGDDGDFVHDIIGIERHLNRETFKLENCFVPRFAQRS